MLPQVIDQITKITCISLFLRTLLSTCNLWNPLSCLFFLLECSRLILGWQLISNSFFFLSPLFLSNFKHLFPSFAKSELHSNSHSCFHRNEVMTTNFYSYNLHWPIFYWCDFLKYFYYFYYFISVPFGTFKVVNVLNQ